MSAIIGVVCGLVTMSLWALANTLEAKAARAISPFRVLLYAQTAGLIGVLIAATFFGMQPLPLATIALASLAGVLTIPAIWSLYTSVRRGKLAVVIPIASSYPVLTVLLSVAFFGERLTLTQTIGVVLCVGGAVLLTTDWKQLLSVKKHGWLPGTGYAALAAASWGFQNALLKPLTSTDWFTPFVYIQLATVVSAWLVALVIREQLAFPKLGFLIVGSGLLSTLAFVVLGLGISVSLASIVAPISAAFPLPMVLLGWLILKETPTRWQITLSTVTVAGIVLLAL